MNKDENGEQLDGQCGRGGARTAEGAEGVKRPSGCSEGRDSATAREQVAMT